MIVPSSSPTSSSSFYNQGEERIVFSVEQNVLSVKGRAVGIILSNEAVPEGLVYRPDPPQRHPRGFVGGAEHEVHPAGRPRSDVAGERREIDGQEDEVTVDLTIVQPHIGVGDDDERLEVKLSRCSGCVRLG